MGRFTGSKIRGVFYPEAIEVMGSAFDAAWHELQNSSQPLTTGELGGRTRYVLAKIIVALIDDGERDPRTLSHKALSRLCATRPRSTVVKSRPRRSHPLDAFKNQSAESI